MEKQKLNINNISSSNFNQSFQIKKQTLIKDISNTSLIKHYKLIKRVPKGKSNKQKSIKLSNTLYININKVKSKFKKIYYQPARRINSTRINPIHLYKKLNITLLEESEKYPNFLINNKRKSMKLYKKLNAYYYSANIPIKNKYIVDSLSQDKTISMRSEKKSNVASLQKKIDTLAKNLNLFPYKKKYQNLKSITNPFTKRIERINRKEYFQNYNNILNDSSHNTGTSIPSLYIHHSSLAETVYTKNSQRSHIFLKKENNNNNSINININSSNTKSKDLSEKNEIKEVNESKDNKENNKNEKKIMKSVKSDSMMDLKDEFLYKKIFEYNKINQKRKPVNIIDNKLNIFYCENLFQYNQKMAKINDILVKRGKPMIHQGVEKNSKENMINMIKKLHFMKKIVDYVYPNMVLYKVNHEKKRAFKAKSIDFKLPRSQINLINLQEEQKKIDSYFGNSFVIRRY